MKVQVICTTTYMSVSQVIELLLWGVKIMQKLFGLLQGKYCILWIDLVLSWQKLGILIENKMYENRRWKKCFWKYDFGTFWEHGIRSIHNIHSGPGWPVYKVKCLCSRGQEWKREEGHSRWHFNIWFLWYKTLWFKFGHDIYAGFKIPRL